jgi:hypothetical protein
MYIEDEDVFNYIEIENTPSLNLLLADIKSRFDQPSYKAYVNIVNLVIKNCTRLKSFGEELYLYT